MSVSKDDVRYIAKLARLRFSEEDEERLATQLSAVLGYMEKLDELDTSGVRPTSHVLDLHNVARRDRVDQRISRDDALKNAPDAGDAYFRVPKVID